MEQTQRCLVSGQIFKIKPDIYFYRWGSKVHGKTPNQSPDPNTYIWILNTGHNLFFFYASLKNGLNEKKKCVSLFISRLLKNMFFLINFFVSHSLTFCIVCTFVRIAGMEWDPVAEDRSGSAALCWPRQEVSLNLNIVSLTTFLSS